MRPPRQIPRPQFGYAPSIEPYTPFCGLCGQDVKVEPSGKRFHLKDNDSGELDPEMDQDHSPRSEDYHEEHRPDED